MNPSEVIRDQSVLVAFCNGSESSRHFVGVPRGYYAQPTYMIEVDGVQRNWAASLCREATAQETIDYWRNRALSAEKGATP